MTETFDQKVARVSAEETGSTAVPGLAAKPIVDMLVEVTDLEMTRDQMAPVQK